MPARLKLKLKLELIIPAIIIVMSLTSFAQQPLTAPQARDVTKLQSKTVADMQMFSIEKLYMTARPR